MIAKIPSHWREHYAALLATDDILADRIASSRWPDLLSYANSKLNKGKQDGVLTAGLHLSPAAECGVNFCPSSTKGCREACLGHSAGHMRFTVAKRARLLRSIFLLTQPEAFREQLTIELDTLTRKAAKLALTPSARLNTTSDLPWERMIPEIFVCFPEVLFYDYTKDRRRMKAFLKGPPWPRNYHLTFSYTGRNWSFCDFVLRSQGNVAVVFHPDLPRKHNGYTVIDGDETDCRSLDPTGVIVGLHAKGAARKDTTGFVVRYP